jgi:RNA polymerase sigma factor (TIGR02999 family)
MDNPTMDRPDRQEFARGFVRESEEPSRAGEVTVLLDAIRSGDRRAAVDLLPLVYDELRALARSRLARLAPGQTLQPTALVHEAFLKLVGRGDPGWEGTGHFFGAAARAMRDILVDAARRRSRLRHGGDRDRVELDEDLLSGTGIQLPTDDILQLDEALRRLETKHPERAEIVMLRYFAGLTNEQVAQALNVSTRTVERGWRFARAWLHDHLGRALSEPQSIDESR